MSNDISMELETIGHTISDVSGIIHLILESCTASKKYQEGNGVTHNES